MRKVFDLMLIGCVCGLMVTGCGGDTYKKDTEQTETVEATETEKAIETEKVAKEEGKDIRWPKSELSDLLPVPEAEVGDVILNDSKSFSVEINNMSEDGFNDYVDKCIENGFSVDYTKIDGSFFGNNEKGYYLMLSYMSDDEQMLISLNAPEETTPEPTEAPAEPTEQPTEAPVETETPAEPAVSQDTIRPEIKEAIDSYEAFFDEYCAFMKKYEESNGDLSLMADYADYLARYADMLQKFEAMENEELTDAELAYYMEASGRIMEKTAQFY